ncbi:unnamed protein product [Prunus brigantina]
MFRFQRLFVLLELGHSMDFNLQWRIFIRCTACFWRHISRIQGRNIDCSMKLKAFLVSLGRLSGLWIGYTGTCTFFFCIPGMSKDGTSLGLECFVISK